MENPKQSLPPIVLTLMYIILSVVIGYALSMVPDSFYIQAERKISHKFLLIIILILIPATCILFYYYTYYSKYHNTLPKLKYIYPVYWDKKGNPYCPSCKKPLNRFNKIRLICNDKNNCRADIILKDINGKTYSIDDVVENIKQLWKNNE